MRLRSALALTAGTAVITPAVLFGPAAVAEAHDGVHRGVRAPDARPAVPAETAAATPAPGTAVGPDDDRPEEQPADQQPTCGKAADPDFPIRTRIHGGPGTVHPGAGFQGWKLDLTNTTRELCHHIHPVVILTGRDPGLSADRVDVQFHDEDAGRWRPVPLERTSADEIVGAFDDGFRGFVVPAGKTVTVKVRLSLATGTAPNAVTVNAAVVQRKGSDGDWVGASGDYRFAVTEAPKESPSARSPEQLATTGSGSVARIVAAAATIALGTGVLVFVTRRFGARRR